MAARPREGWAPQGAAALTRTFNVHGLRLTVRVDTPSLAQRLQHIIGPFEVDDSAPGDFVLEIRHEADAFADVAPPDMQEYWRGALPGGIPIACHRNASARETLLPGRARMRLAERVADVRVAPGAEGCLEMGCILPALCEFLARCAHYVIHAATLSLGDAGARRALLLCGPGGVGKTTTALALAHAGLQLLSDDATFLHTPHSSLPTPHSSLVTRRAPPALRVWGLPRPCKVHRRSVELMPWLESHCRGARAVADEYLVELAPLAGPAALGMAEPAVVIFLEERNPHGHRLRPLDKVEAVARLADENVRAADLRGQGPAGDAFRALVQMARHAGTHLLSVGPELDALPEMLRPLLAASR